MFFAWQVWATTWVVASTLCCTVWCLSGSAELSRIWCDVWLVGGVDPYQLIPCNQFNNPCMAREEGLFSHFPIRCRCLLVPSWLWGLKMVGISGQSANFHSRRLFFRRTWLNSMSVLICLWLLPGTIKQPYQGLIWIDLRASVHHCSDNGSTRHQRLGPFLTRSSEAQLVVHWKRSGDRNSSEMRSDTSMENTTSSLRDQDYIQVLPSC